MTTDDTQSGMKIFFILQTRDHGTFHSDGDEISESDASDFVTLFGNNELKFMRLTVDGDVVTIPKAILETSILSFYESREKTHTNPYNF